MSNSETTRAFCYLGVANDERNKVLLTEKQLIVIQKGRTHIFDLLQIKTLDFNERKPMLYLLTGGIVVPFTAVAFYRNFLDPFPTLLLLVAGLFALYYGWIGYQTFTVNEFTHHSDFKLGYISSNLKEFVTFASKHLPINSNLDLRAEKMIYHITPSKSWKRHLKSNHYDIPTKEPFIHASSYHQLSGTLQKHFKNQKDLLLLTIDPLKVNAEIKYEDLSDSGQLFPHIYGPLNTDAVVKIAPVPLPWTKVGP